jgi:heme/copper-type cytochrome/quinol oxidase subunit 2
MNRPRSLTLLIFFAVWSAFKGLESLLRPASSKSMFEEYNVVFLYYLSVAVAVLGGGAVAYAIIKQKEWGVRAGIVWLFTGIIYILYTGVVSITNKGLMEQIMVATREAKGRPTDSISDFINSSAYEITIVATTVVMIGIMVFFLWKIHQHRSYFSNAV